ncbi:MAG: DUF4291 domain-containing protein [Minicystis sp.]
MNLEPYPTQLARWPTAGRHILADFDADSVVVYQAYTPAIAVPAAQNNRFGPPWSRSRMTWIKPGFLWMMYRAGWATKENQEAILRIRLRRDGFDEILRQAVHSTHIPEVYGTREAWDDRVARSDVRLQWDPDHHPAGAKQERRAIQLGLRGAALASFADHWILAIEDITAFVREQHAHVRNQAYKDLLLPREDVYPVTDPAVAAKLGVDTISS